MFPFGVRLRAYDATTRLRRTSSGMSCSPCGRRCPHENPPGFLAISILESELTLQLLPHPRPKEYMENVFFIFALKLTSRSSTRSFSTLLTSSRAGFTDGGARRA